MEGEGWRVRGWRGVRSEEVVRVVVSDWLWYEEVRGGR